LNHLKYKENVIMKMNLVEQYIKLGSKYPELDKIAQKIANDTGKNINKSVQNVKSEMPYKAQYVLEEVIKHLESMV